MRFLTFIWKSLVRRKTRSILTIVGLAVAVAAMVSLVGISSQFERSFFELYNTRGVDLVVQKAGTATQLSSDLDESLGLEIDRLPGVKHVTGGLMDVVSFPDEGLMTVVVDGWPPDDDRLNKIEITSGRKLKGSEPHAAMLGHVVAANLGKKVGDEIELYSEKFKVVGIFESFSVYENGTIVVALREIQRLMDRPLKVTGFVVLSRFPNEPEEVERLSKKISDLRPGQLSVQATANFVQNIDQIRIASASAWVTSAIAMVIGAIGMLNTMVMSVFERTREIGTLRALGWRKLRVMRMILWEALLLSLGGAIVGTIAAVALAKWLSTLPTTAGLIEGDIAPIVMVQGFFLAILVGVAGSAYPAYWAATLSPVDALRRG